MYLMRLVYHCQRGKAPEVLECLKVLKQRYASRGHTNGRICIDRMGRMDTAVFEFEVENLDPFFTWLQDAYAHLSPEAAPLVERLNASTVEGYREVYEVIG